MLLLVKLGFLVLLHLNLQGLLYHLLVLPHFGLDRVFLFLE
jgi:hypothetical protein